MIDSVRFTVVISALVNRPARSPIFSVGSVSIRVVSLESALLCLSIVLKRVSYGGHQFLAVFRGKFSDKQNPFREPVVAGVEKRNGDIQYFGNTLQRLIGGCMSALFVLVHARAGAEFIHAGGNAELLLRHACCCACLPDSVWNGRSIRAIVG